MVMLVRRFFKAKFLAIFLLFSVGAVSLYLYSKQSTASEPSDLLVTDKVYLKVSINGKSVGTITLGLFGMTTPVTVKNFKSLASAPTGSGYRGSQFHRVIRGFMAQGGDFVSGDGRGGRSSFGGRFADENFRLRHCGAGWLSMANSGPDTNGSQFFITFAKTAWLDGKHVVFGKILSGMSTLRAIESVPTDQRDRPTQPVVIEDCGVVKVFSPFTVSAEASTEYE